MIPLEVRAALRQFLDTPAGYALMRYLFENAPAAPCQVGAAMEPHHVQVNYGHGLGATDRLKQIKALAEDIPADETLERPTLFNTRDPNVLINSHDDPNYHG